ncbi:MAG: SUMF1/EgtB/PvdO family nonheme iron enzyme [Spirochaetes bacterium]|nr:SUMF1/EgtB/PvdO family nonheme iron enzyme [Spirochaetota bacterium]
MSEHEVTQSQFEDVMGVNPSEADTGGDAPNRPERRLRWYDGNSETGDGETTHPVGTKNANEPGLHDMSGNVLEWTWDRHGAFYPDGDQTDYRGAASGSDRVLRGDRYGVVA